MSEKLKCDRCGNNLNGHCITIYNDDKTVKEVICTNCDAFEYKEIYKQTGRLNSRLIINNILDVYNNDPLIKQKIQDEIVCITFIIGLFEHLVWFFGGLQKYIQEADFKGHSMKITEGIVAMVYAVAGRVMITLHDQKGNNITLITEEDSIREGSMGLQSISATSSEAVNILNQFMDFVQNHGLHFKADKNICMI